MLSTLHIIGSRHSGGAERFYVRLVQALAQRGVSTTAVNRPGSAVARDLAGLVPQKHVAMRNVFDIFSRWGIRRIIEQLQPQIVQTYMGRATRLTHLPENSNAVHIARLGGFYKLNGYRHADAWVGNTKSICDYLRENGFPADRVYHIGNFIEQAKTPSVTELEQLRAAYRIPTEAWVVVSAGRFVAKKGFSDLLDAFAQLPEEIHERPLYLIVVGQGPLEKQLQDYAQQLGIAERVRWPGWQRELTPFYTVADLFVCPSRHEPLGNVILEAWSCSAPVISTVTHGAKELITDSDNGVLVPCEDPQALAREMKHLLFQGPETRAELGRRGKALVLAKYNPERVVDQYLDLYQQLRSHDA